MNSLMHGDCLELLENIKPSSIDMILCDLPYGTTACEWDKIIPIDKLFTLYKQVLKFNGSIVLTAKQPFTTMLIQSNMDIFKYCWVWIKNRPTGCQHSKNMPMSKHEDIIVFSQAPCGHVSQLSDRRMHYNPQGCVHVGMTSVNKSAHGKYMGERPNQIGKIYEKYTNYPNTVLYFDKEECHLHPTQKPVALFEYLIKTYTNEGDTVLDNCAGSGTTAIAAINTKRNYCIMEKEQQYIDIIKKRIEDRNSIKSVELFF